MLILNAYFMTLLYSFIGRKQFNNNQLQLLASIYFKS